MREFLNSDTALIIDALQISRQLISTNRRLKYALSLSFTLLFWQTTVVHPAPPVKEITAGDTGDLGFGHSLFIERNGSLWGMGSDEYGQLGRPFPPFGRPVAIVSNRVIAVSCGADFTLFLKRDGSLWGMGNNQYGQLGYGTVNRVLSPVEIVPNEVVAISCGGYHSLFLKRDGSLWGLGDNSVGQLGVGTSTNGPIQVVSNGVVAIAAGFGYSLFLRTNGSVWGMGYNTQGQLGGASYNSIQRTPVQIVASSRIAESNIVAIAAGYNFDLFLKPGGSLWGLGANYFGQLGDGAFYNSLGLEQIVSSNVVAMAAGYSHSLFLKRDGSLWAMGDNRDGELGAGTSTNRPTEVVSNGVVAIAAGGGYSLFLKSDGSLWGMGHDEFGQLGDGFDSNSLLPEQIVPPPQPVLTEGISAESNLQFQATCQFGGTFYLLESSNLTQPLSQWTPVWSNIVRIHSTNNFNVVLTNAVQSSQGQEFYILESP